MSTESQSENIWQYAIDVHPVDGAVKNASLNVGRDQMADDTTVDFSDGMNSIPSKFSFQGLAETQTQSQGGRIPQETSMEDSQKENKHLLPAPSGSQSLLPPDAMITGPTPPSAELSRPENAGKIIGRAGGAVGKPSSSSHVTQHVTGAWTRVNPSVKGRGLHATPLKLRNKTVSFLSPTARPPPPALSRISTMPPARNRYAPRDIDHSSQDSFAGPPIRQDLTAFVRSERVFNSTFIRSGRDGEPGEVFEHPSHVSSTSLSEPPDEDEIMSFSQPEQPDDEPSTSQPFRAAFDPGPSPPRAPDPVVLVKDSQSQHSDDDEDGRSGNKSGNKSNKERDKDGEGQDHPSTALPSPSHSSSSSSFHLPSEDVMVATQPNTQSTDSDMQPTQTDPQPDISIPQSVDTSLSRPSPLPVPPHRMRQIAMLQAARLGGRDEIIPETPASTTVPSVRASVAPSRNSTSIVGAPYMEALHEENLEISPPRIEVGRIDKGKGKQMVDPEAGGTLSKRPLPMGKAKAAAAMPTVTSPSRVTRSPTKSTRPDDPSNRPIGGLPTSSPKRIQQHSAGDVVVPDSQAEQREKRQGLLTTPSKRYPGPRQGEVVPDSQEEETQAAARAPSTSPAIPLIDLVARDALEAEPPTPTPAAVKSSLRKGELPEGVTHTRGRGRPSSADPNRRVTVSTSVSDNREKDQSEEDDALTPIPEDGNMVVDEQLSPKRTRLRGRLRKSTPIRSVKAKAVALPKTRKTVVKVARAQPATTDAPVAGPSTRSRKRKSAAQAEPAESSKGSEVPLNAPPKKRQRGLTVTPAPAGAVLLDTRVVARRPDLGNIYMPGTVAMETTLIDPIPLSTVFSVKFDDGHNEDVDVAFMRQYEPEPGDIVQSRLRRKGKLSVCPAQVLDVERWANEEKVEVQELGRGPDADDYYVKGCDIGISQERILQQWNERRVSTRTLLRDQKFDQPVPNESLADIGFIVTLPDLPKSKRSLIKIIEASSGILYEDWSAIVSLNGTVEVAGRRMSGKASDMRLGKEFRRTTPKAVFCLTDEPRTTPKYLISLALGVPCLSIEWVLERVMQDNAEHHVDWPAYVLPAGHNPVTRLAASQAFDRAWWRDVDNLPKLVSQPPVLKPFAGKAFLCIGVPEFLFSKKEFGTFPKVILAMGASFVQAVTEITLVNVNGSQSFDYTVVDDGQDLVEYQDAQAVNVSWIKKCLVTGIEGPIPWPDREGS